MRTTDALLIWRVLAPEGAAVMHARQANVPIYLGGLDEKLSENGYIVPGMGDAGDRQFGTG
ncbi:MAG: hypothetical protein IH859_03645 [Chloroflexi bacterium]|nr:hypothetical protein [Chloroflexota bacterium]